MFVQQSSVLLHGSTEETKPNTTKANNTETKWQNILDHKAYKYYW